MANMEQVDAWTGGLFEKGKDVMAAAAAVSHLRALTGLDL